VRLHSGFKKYFFNTSWLFFERALRIISGILIGAWVARYLGPEQFGIFSYAHTIVALFSIFASFGIDGILNRELVAQKENRDKLLGTAFGIKFFGTFFFLLLIFLFLQLSEHSSFEQSMVYIVASSVFLYSFNVIDHYFASIVRSKYVVYINIVSLLISSFLKLYFIYLHAPLLWFAYLVVFDFFVIAAGFVFVYTKQRLSILNWKFDQTIALQLLKDAWPLIFSGIVISIYMKIDQIMLQNMLGNEAVGQYAAALKISEGLLFIPVILTNSLFPAIINAKKIDQHLYNKRFEDLYDLMYILALSISIPLFLLSGFIIETLYASEYAQAAHILRIQLSGMVFVFLGVACGSWFLSENKNKETFYRNLFGAVVNVVLNWIFIPRYGIAAAAYTTVFTHMVISYLSLVFIKGSTHNFMMITRTLFFVSLYRKALKYAKETH
jgi:O-antigen/teichoic acid export membrane protein